MKKKFMDVTHKSPYPQKVRQNKKKRKQEEALILIWTIKRILSVNYAVYQR